MSKGLWGLAMQGKSFGSAAEQTLFWMGSMYAVERGLLEDTIKKKENKKASYTQASIVLASTTRGRPTLLSSLASSVLTSCCWERRAELPVLQR